MGTPDFAVYPLSLLLQNKYSVVSVVTAPDKPAGRGKKLQQSPVKKYAESQNIPVLQPEKLRNSEFVESVRNLEPDVIIVVAFRMLPKIIWEIPLRGTFNLHASLLPQYRGAAPINWAIVNGETETGVTTFFIDDKIDTGHIIAQTKVSIPETANAGDLHNLLMTVGGKLVVETVAQIENNTVQTIPQDKIENESELKSAPKISKEICHIDCNKPVREIYNHIRGFSPYPAAWIRISNGSESLLCKIYSAKYSHSTHQEQIGTITQTKDSLYISCKDGYIYPTEIQLEGKKRMNISDCLRGFSFEGFSINVSST